MYVTVISCVQFYCGIAIFHLDSPYGAVSTEVDKVTCLCDDWDLLRSTEHMKSPDASFGVESKLLCNYQFSQLSWGAYSRVDLSEYGLHALLHAPS